MTTQKVFASYQEIIDLHTESDRVSILGFHTPANSQPLRLLKPFWTAYQKVRYLGCSMTMVPAARLPADPSQVSYEAGEPPIDPRDLLNPILFKGCHGNDMGAILNQFYAGESGSNDIARSFSDSLDHNMVKTSAVGVKPIYESLYYRALTDNTWLKAHPQRGFRKSMRPMVYSLATNTPFNPNTSSLANRGGYVTSAQSGVGEGPDNGTRSRAGQSTLGSGTTTNNSFQAVSAPGLQNTVVSFNNETYTTTWNNPGTYSGQFFMSPNLRSLGWLDTRQWVTGTGESSSYTSSSIPTDSVFTTRLGNNYNADDNRFTLIPKLFMGMCLLPPAYKQEQYFRIVMNHKFAFAKYRGTSMRDNEQIGSIGNVTNMYDADAVSKGDPDDGDKGILDD